MQAQPLSVYTLVGAIGIVSNIRWAVLATVRRCLIWHESQIGIILKESSNVCSRNTSLAKCTPHPAHRINDITYRNCAKDVRSAVYAKSVFSVF